MSESLSSSYSVNQPNSSESEQSLSARHFNVTEPVVAKRICFYKSGDPQFNGIKMVVNNRSYKTFDALLDSLSKRVPLPFGVRNISTPKGRHSITSLEDLEDGKSYICSHQRKMKPINLERASRKPLPWQISRPISARRRAVQLAKENEDGFGHRESKITTPKKMLVFKNGDVRLRRTIVLGKKNTQTFEALLDYMSELMQYPVVKLYTTDGRKIPNLQALILCSGTVVAAGREPFKPSNYESLGYSRPAKLLGIANRVYPKANAKSESENMISSSRSQIFSVSSDKGSSNDNNLNDNNSDSSYLPENHKGIGGTQTVNREDLSVAQFEDDIEKSVHLNQDGSMTVEMKVRFKIKEEETIKWTTTVSRAGLSDEKNATICNSATHAEDCLSNVDTSECIKQKDASFLDSYSKEGESLKQLHTEVSDKESQFDSKMDNICQKNNSADVDVSDVPEENIRPRFYRPPTPGPRRVRKKKTVVESVTLVSEKEVQEKTIGQFSYSEEIQNGENKSEYCMVAQSSTKKSSVSNPRFSDMSDNDLLKLSSESIKEEMLLKVRHKTHDLIGTTNRKTSDVPDEPELVQNVSEKSVVEQDTYNNSISTCKANISDLMPSSKIYKAARPVSADHIHELYLLHSACHGHCQVKMVAPPCSKAPTEKTNSTTGFFPTVNETENQISVRSESVMASHLTGESLSASSLTKKKKKRKSLSNFLEQYIYKNKKDQEISGIIKSEGMLITNKTTQVSATQTTDNCSDMIQKKRNELLLKNSDGSANSDKSICPEDELYHPEISSVNKKRRANRQLTEVKLKSGKKNSSLLSSKSEDGLMTVDSRTETENSQGELSATKEGKHLATNLFEQSPNSATISDPFSELPKDHNLEKEKENVLENLSSKKEKKQKKKKNLSKSPNKLSMSDSAITLETLKQEYFKEDVVEHSLDNYVYSWLKNLSPNAVLPPINKKEEDVNNSDDCHFSKEKIDAFIDKEDRYVTNKVHMIEKKHLFEQNLTKKQLKPLFELEALEASAKPSDEKQTDSLTHDDTAVVEDAKSLLHSEFHHASELRLFHETHISDKKGSEFDIQDTSLCQRKKSEVAVQVDCTIVNEKTGSDVQNNCMSSMLLHELQSTLLGLQKEHSGCIEKTCSLPDLSPPVFGSSSNLLLAWLLILSLRENLIGTIKDDIQKATCSCSEILTQLQFLKQATVLEKVDELKAAFSHFQQSSENNLLHAGRELRKQDVTHSHENMPISEIYNVIHLHEDEKSDEPCIAKDNL
ncbi:RP1 protein, partial [Odontophorus gujanensis]|nr:RP1 protein [Odontophorus gujanensis]